MLALVPYFSTTGSREWGDGKAKGERARDKGERKAPSLSSLTKLG